jgi:hypothetical protein
MACARSLCVAPSFAPLKPGADAAGERLKLTTSEVVASYFSGVTISSTTAAATPTAKHATTTRM